jgi:hypothetical protein
MPRERCDVADDGRRPGRNVCYADDAVRWNGRVTRRHDDVKTPEPHIVVGKHVRDVGCGAPNLRAEMADLDRNRDGPSIRDDRPFGYRHVDCGTNGVAVPKADALFAQEVAHGRGGGRDVHDRSLGRKRDRVRARRRVVGRCRHRTRSGCDSHKQYGKGDKAAQTAEAFEEQTSAFRYRPAARFALPTLRKQTMQVESYGRRAALLWPARRAGTPRR